MKANKYIVVLGDGMADEPIEVLCGKTPLEYAKTPTMDAITPYSEIGLVKTTPDKMNPSSDPTNMGLLGYDPFEYYRGRASLEAVGMGIKMDDDDIAIRMNFVTVSDGSEPYESKRLLDFCAGNLENNEAEILLCDLKPAISHTLFSTYFGAGFRHILIGSRDSIGGAGSPHDIVGEEIRAYLPSSIQMRKLMHMSYYVLNKHLVNVAREKVNKPKANSIWLWGEGSSTILPPFYTQTGKRSVLISASDAMMGIGICAGMDIIRVDGATGTVHTNFIGKALAVIESLITKNYDFVYLHIGAPDTASHLGNLNHKILSIENIDTKIIKVIKHELAKHKIAYRMLVLPDHSTPIRLRTHTNVPVPYMLFDSTRQEKIVRPHNLMFCETSAQCSGNFFDKGQLLIQHFLNSTM